MAGRSFEEDRERQARRAKQTSYRMGIMKPLLPTLKEKKRYIVYTIHSETPVSSASIIKELHKILGLFESAKAGLQDISFDKKTQQGVLRCSLASVSKVRAALTLIQYSKESKVRITIIGVSGILNKTKRFEEKVTIKS